MRKTLLSTLTLAAVLMVPVQPAVAGLCPDATFDGGDTLPQQGTVIPSINDVTFGGNCAERGHDFVVCFTPENDCAIDVRIEILDQVQEGVGSALNVFEGPCAPNINTCIDSATGQVNVSPVNLLGAIVTGGTEVCVGVDLTGELPVLLRIRSSPGAPVCGSLPVELLDVGVER